MKISEWDGASLIYRDAKKGVVVKVESSEYEGYVRIYSERGEAEFISVDAIVDLASLVDCPKCGRLAVVIEMAYKWAIRQECGECGHSYASWMSPLAKADLREYQRKLKHGVERDVYGERI
ncbi:MAG: hypothetical protein AAB486_03420 [Patescibacteria group bacterium]